MKWKKEAREWKVRALRRRKMGKLKDLVIAPKTRARYAVRVARFTAELADAGVPFPRSIRELDEELESAVGELWWKGAPKGWAADLLSGVQHFVPWTRKKLVASWRVYGAWNRREYPDRAPPMDRRLVLALGWWFWSRGRRRTALTVLLGFHCYVRTGELLGLRKASIAIGRDGRGVVSLGVTKGRRVEMVTVDDPALGRLLARELKEVKDGERVVEIEEKEFRQGFQAAMEEFGVAELRYKPYSLRRGGATEDFRKHGRLDRALLRGRWKGHTAARQYILEGMEMGVRMKRSPVVELGILRAAQKLSETLGRLAEEA
jgi:integrase